MLAVALVAMSIEFGYWEGLLFNPPWLAAFAGNLWATVGVWVVITLLALGMHYWIRQRLAKRIAATLSTNESYGNLSTAFLKSTPFWRSIFQSSPAGWGGRTRRRLDTIRHATDRFVQHLNDRFTSPSGEQQKSKSA